MIYNSHSTRIRSINHLNTLTLFNMLAISSIIICFGVTLIAVTTAQSDTAISNTNHCPLECFNGGVCFHDRKYASFYCECSKTTSSGYTGVHCEAPVVVCSSGDRCLNNGECKDTGGCKCIDGFGGEFCEDYTGPCDPTESDKYITAECARKAKSGPSGGAIFLIVAASFGSAVLVFFVGRHLGRRSSMEDKSFASRNDPSVEKESA